MDRRHLIGLARRVYGLPPCRARARRPGVRLRGMGVPRRSPRRGYALRVGITKTWPPASAARCDLQPDLTTGSGPDVRRSCSGSSAFWAAHPISPEPRRADARTRAAMGETRHTSAPKAPSRAPPEIKQRSDPPAVARERRNGHERYAAAAWHGQVARRAFWAKASTAIRFPTMGQRKPHHRKGASEPRMLVVRHLISVSAMRMRGSPAEARGSLPLRPPSPASSNAR